MNQMNVASKIVIWEMVIVLTLIIGFCVYYFYPNTNNNVTEIGGREYTESYIKNLEYYDSTGQHLFLYDRVYEDILNQYTTKANVKKELSNYLTTNGYTQSIQDLGQEQYNKELSELRKFYLQNELYKDLLDVKQKDLDEAYKENKEIKNYIAVTMDSEFIKENPKFDKQLKNMLNGIKGTDDIKKVEEFVAKTQQGKLENLQYNKFRFEQLPKERQEIMNNLTGKEVKVENTSEKVGVTFYYKYLGTSMISQNNFEGQYLKDLADKEDIGELDDVMKRLNDKKRDNMHFTDDLIERIKSEIQILDTQQQEAEKQEQEPELEEVKDEELKSTIKSSGKSDIEDEVNSYTK